MHHLLEDLASQTLADLRLRAPISAHRLARGLRLKIERWDGDNACVVGTRVLLPRGLSRRRRHGIIAHEVAHVLLDDADLPNTEENADYLAGALLVPLHALDLDLQEMGVRLPSLLKRHRNASSTLLATRVGELLRAGVSLWRADVLQWHRLYRNREPSMLIELLARRARARAGEAFVGDDAYACSLGRDYVVALEL